MFANPPFVDDDRVRARQRFSTTGALSLVRAPRSVLALFAFSHLATAGAGSLGLGVYDEQDSMDDIYGGSDSLSNYDIEVSVR